MIKEQFFLDTNPIIRALTNDHPEQSKISQQVLLKIQNGEIKAMTTSIHIAEVIYVFEGKYYNIDRRDIAKKILKLISLDNLKIIDKKELKAALIIYGNSFKKIDIADAYAIVMSRRNGIKKLITFDKDFEQFKEIERIDSLNITMNS